MKNTPTKSQFEAFEGAYEYFNQVLFHYELPKVILNLSRKSKAMGFVAPFRWKAVTEELKEGEESGTLSGAEESGTLSGAEESGTLSGAEGRIHELSINPEILCLSIIDVYSTLVHEQCHIWQYHCGKPSRKSYHNKEWANKMLEVGLTPSSTGKPGGKMTGQKMSDYPTLDGVFLKALDEMPEHFKLPFVSIEGELKYRQHSAGGNPSTTGESQQSKKNKIKYSCPSCAANIWAKPDLNVICGDCNITFDPLT